MAPRHAFSEIVDRVGDRLELDMRVREALGLRGKGSASDFHPRRQRHLTRHGHAGSTMRCRTALGGILMVLRAQFECQNAPQPRRCAERTEQRMGWGIVVMRRSVALAPNIDGRKPARFERARLGAYRWQAWARCCCGRRARRRRAWAFESIGRVGCAPGARRGVGRGRCCNGAYRTDLHVRQLLQGVAVGLPGFQPLLHALRFACGQLVAQVDGFEGFL